MSSKILMHESGENAHTGPKPREQMTLVSTCVIRERERERERERKREKEIEKEKLEKETERKVGER